MLSELWDVADNLECELVFSWWVPCSLKRRDGIIAAVKSKCHRSAHKFSIEIPKMVERASEIDKGNGDTLWGDALENEISMIGKALKILEDGASLPQTVPLLVVMSCLI